ncbi:YhcH/YjgK/YiaL family protein [Clostridium estertheticum]|uniref:YhcH/YjgK/YiaL family protein n=1 Tax=Clostridium estertheticum TaxID=238834 RepID=UPI001CF1DF0F|nr:YhcH/YjgK/YiaL family protein [Clostridium estertheticum]MCB2305835.1 YhcH/YjgK/YiaL family protein [Clostridium estertheticum]MCB2344196.1 YhcH/YjgK/YiaL family protein [Clostridium estertheticum]MCB2348190.1 YhcH/YjgK/YiaL family protein [Clostridium estertheticum]WAG45825.1 YhcH/YjgK/YiaL family protein [Clostridium estertheticum]
MIINKLSNAEQYYGISQRIEKGLKYLKDTDLENIEIGKYEIDGKNIIAVVSEYETKDIEKGKWEAHKKHIDIQFVVSGKEKIGYACINEMIESSEYNEEKDVIFLKGDGDMLLVNEGTFAIFAPEDVHMPTINAENSQHVKKVVVKILV